MKGSKQKLSPLKKISFTPIAASLINEPPIHGIAKLEYLPAH